MPSVSDTNIKKWARFALTGDDAGTDPTDSQLTFILPSAKRVLADLYPCCGAGGVSLSTATDVAAYEEAAGYVAAGKYVQSPAGRRFAGNVVSVRTGPITETRKDVAPEDAACAAAREAASAMNTVECVRAAIIAARRASSGRGDMFELAGRRRLIGEPLSLEGAILGTGDGTTTEERIV